MRQRDPLPAKGNLNGCLLLHRWQCPKTPCPASLDMLKTTDRASWHRSSHFGGDFWCGADRADRAALHCLAQTEPWPACSQDVFALQQLGGGQREVSTPVAWMYCMHARTFWMFSSGPADTIPMVAWATLAEEQGLQVSVCLSVWGLKWGVCILGLDTLDIGLSYLLALSEVKHKFIQETIAKIQLHHGQAFGGYLYPTCRTGLCTAQHSALLVAPDSAIIKP